MTTDKEELRKEFASKFCFTTSLGNININELDPYKYIDWFYSKLEAKDKEIAEWKQKLEVEERLSRVATEIHKGQEEEITDLKAEIEKNREIIMQMTKDEL